MSQRIIMPAQDALDAYLELRSIWANSPELYARQRLGMKPTWQQRQTFEAIAPEGAKVTIRSGHGTGKTGSMAGIVLWFLETREYPKIPCTAPTSHQLRDVLWAEIAKWIRRANQLSVSRGDPPLLWLGNMFRLTNDRIYDVSASGEWFATARTSSKENPDALQGFHAGDIEIDDSGTGIARQDGGGQILFMVDEASGVHDAVFEAAEGALSSHGARFLMAANPTKSSGYFAASHRQNRGDFTALHFKSSESPLVDPSYRPNLVRKWGEGSNVVRVRADGDFPKQDDDSLIALEWAESALDRDAPSDNNADTRIGIDVARFGDDRTVFTVRKGRHVPFAKIAAKQDTMQTAGQAVQLLEKYGGTAYVDVGGLGAGVADRLRELGKPLIEVNFGSAAPSRKRHQAERDDSPGQKGQSAQAKLIRDLIWLEMADWFQYEEPTFAGADKQIAEDLAGEVSTVKYRLDSSGKLQIEPKDETKKRLGFSPDIADSLACTFHPGTTGPRYSFEGERAF
jgi:hypothetical protein